MMRAGLFLFVFLSGLAPVSATAQSLEVTLTNGATTNITGADGACRAVTNACGATIMAPSKTVSEWQSYYGGAKPACVTLAACGQCASPWGTTYADGTVNEVVSPNRYAYAAGCTTASGGPACSTLRAQVSCSAGVLICRDGYGGITSCESYIHDSCTNQTCDGGGAPP